ncbi:MAG: ROK family transcriptional regulator, partial [Micromonosporaceae bacterium]
MAQQTTGAPTPPNLIRAVNDRAALEALARRGSLTRPEVGALLGLSKPTASELLARLQQAGLVVSLGVREGGPGRAAGLYGINPQIGHVGCVDVTPSGVEVRVADILGAVVGEHRVPTPGRTAPDIVALLRDGLAGACEPAGLGIGDLRHAVIGIQGALNPYTGKLGYAAHLAGWHRPDLRESLSTGLGVPVAVENDVNLAALAEQAHGLAGDSRDFLLLWASDGLGMALVINGRLHRGATGGAGEVGYMPAPGAPIPHPTARPANYGFHALAGGPALRKALRPYGFHGGTAATAVQAAARTWGATAPEVADRAAGGLGE